MRAVVGMGSNLGSRAAYLDAAAALLADAVVARSAVYETAPIGPPQPSYLNAALLLDVEGSAEALLDRLLGIEAQLGRVREVRWGPRTVDLDVLVVEGVSAKTAKLTVPHPRLEERAFALAPLLDVAGWLEPRYRLSLDRLGGPPPRFVQGNPSTEDALAQAVNHWLAAPLIADLEDPSGGLPTVGVQRIEAPNAALWVREATDLPGACAVAIEPMGLAGVRGTVLQGPSSRGRPGVLRGEGLQVVVIAGPPKVG